MLSRWVLCGDQRKVEAHGKQTDASGHVNNSVSDTKTIVPVRLSEQLKTTHYYRIREYEEAVP